MDTIRSCDCGNVIPKDGDELCRVCARAGGASIRRRFFQIQLPGRLALPLKEAAAKENRSVNNFVATVLMRELAERAVQS
jgi:predicted HicB family RNase H-like nuclease